MKKTVLSIVITIAFVLYSWHAHNEQVQIAASPVGLPASRPTSSSSAQPRRQATAAASVPGAGYRDGLYIGSVADAYYGNIQVQITIRSGSISDVTFLRYPNDRSTSIEVNQQAMPYLKQEAIQAQSAQIDVVSGATDTSQAFIESLSSALNQARI